MKKEVLERLKENSSQYVSGEVLSDILGVSRTAVWKYIRELKNDGYLIESSSKKGYKLISVPDILNACEIKHGLRTVNLGKNIHYFKVIDSTNSYAKKAASEGCPDGTVIVAETQTAGRGRLGRAWNSTDKKGIWMSVVLRPVIAPQDIQIITMAASIAVVSAIRQVTGIAAGIKWPNDIILDGKKVCGILTEMSSEMERVNFLVLGIGINVNQENSDFPDELKNSAISLRTYADEQHQDTLYPDNIKWFDRCEIIKRVLLELERVYDKINKGAAEEIIEECKRSSVTLGKQVRVTVKGTQYVGSAVDITGEGKLVVNCSDGVVREIVSGEIMVRSMLGYV